MTWSARRCTVSRTPKVVADEPIHTWGGGAGSTLILAGQRPFRQWLGHVKRAARHTFGGGAGACLRVELLRECGRWTGAAGQTLLQAVWSGLLQGRQELLAAPKLVGSGQFEVLGTLLAQTLSSRLYPQGFVIGRLVNWNGGVMKHKYNLMTFFDKSQYSGFYEAPRDWSTQPRSYWPSVPSFEGVGCTYAN